MYIENVNFNFSEVHSGSLTTKTLALTPRTIQGRQPHRITEIICTNGFNVATNFGVWSTDEYASWFTLSGSTSHLIPLAAAAGLTLDNIKGDVNTFTLSGSLIPISGAFTFMCRKE